MADKDKTWFVSTIDRPRAGEFSSLREAQQHADKLSQDVVFHKVGEDYVVEYYSKVIAVISQVPEKKEKGLDLPVLGRMQIKEYIELKGAIEEHVKSCSILPSFSELGKKFQLTFDELETIFEDIPHANVNVAIGSGGGFATLDREEWTVEIL